MTDEDLICEVRAWLSSNWTPANTSKPQGAALLEWRERVHAQGYAAPSWPTVWGGLGLSETQSKLVEQQFRAAGAPGSGQDRTNIAANTLLRYGTDAARTELLAGFVTGKFATCLLYSEPGAGSDLAAVRTRADRENDSYVVTGQKVWTSAAQAADFGLLIARTDWDAPKHAGLSYFICPMKQSGVEVRPIHQINGESHFNEVFLDAARLPAAYLLSTEGDGWKVMQTALAYERLIMAEGATERRKGTDTTGLDVIALARSYGKLDDPVIRRELAEAIAWRRLNSLNGQRAKAAAEAGESSPLMSLGKLAMSRVLHNDARVRRLIIGARSLLDGPEYPEAEDINYRSLHAYMNSIGGGTDQIQRNIIGERVLGLPRELEVDRSIPFRESLAVKSSA